MTTIYVYKLVDRKFLDVFEANTELAAKRLDGSFFPSRVGLNKSKEIIVRFTKCLINCSGKGITQYNKKCAWIICTPETVFRNTLWLPEYNISKALDIFKKYNNDKIDEYTKFIDELKETNKHMEDEIRSICTHKNPNGSLALNILSNGNYQCEICGKKFSTFQANILNNKK